MRKGRCSHCKDKMPIKRRCWGFMPYWFFPRKLKLHKWKTILLCDDCLKIIKGLHL